MKKLSFLLFLMVGLFTACEEGDFDYKGYEPISEECVFDSLTLQQEMPYYEIRRNLCTHSRYYEVVFSKGEKFYSDSLFSSTGKGINNSNGDICLFFNILTYDGTDYRFLENLPEVLSFLGEIDSKGDAVFWAYLNGYYFIFGDPASGIKQTSDGFFIYAYKLVKMCTPVQIDKFWLKIDKTGNIEVLGEKLFSRIENGCI